MGEFADMEIDNMLDRMMDPYYWGDEDDSEASLRYNSRRYRDSRSYSSAGRRKQYQPKEFVRGEAPRMLDMEVSQVHARTEKAVCVSGVTSNGYAFDNIWMPISQIDMNGNMIRFPEWILKSRLQADRNAAITRTHCKGIDQAADQLVKAMRRDQRGNR